MQTTEELQSALSNLPLHERENVLAMLEDSIVKEYQNMAETSLQADLALCKERLARFDKGETTARPWDEAMQHLFGDTQA